MLMELNSVKKKQTGVQSQMVRSFNMMMSVSAARVVLMYIYSLTMPGC